MALADDDPTLGSQDFTWPPPQWGMVAPSQQIESPEYGGISGSLGGTLPPPPPPPPPPQKIASQAGPSAEEVPAGALPPDAPVPVADVGASPMQPGLGIPQHAIDSLPPVPEAPPPPQVDAISGGEVPPPPVEPKLGEVGGAGPWAGSPQAIERDQKLADDAEAARLARDPYALAKANTDAEAAKRSEYVAQATKLATDNEKQARAEYQAHVAARLKTQQDSAQVQADAAKLANTKIDPNLNTGIGQSIINLVALTVGGAVSKQTGGRNLALEQLNKAIDNHIQTQQMDLSNQWKALGVRREGVADAAMQEADGYRDATTLRLGMYGAAMESLKTKMQDFDPHGSMVRDLAGQYRQIAGAYQKASADFDQKQFENNFKVEGPFWQKQLEINETKRHNMAEEAAKAAKAGAGAGVTGSPTNPSYTVPTGFFNPFDPTQPIMGKRQVGGKGEDPKERADLGQQLQTYKHVSDTLTKMRNIAAELGGGGKGIEESIWKGRKGTLASKYDAAKEELTSYLTKAIGDRPTQGQLELQAHRIPDRKGVFESADPDQLLADQQDAAARAFAADLDTIGVDPAPVVAAARKAGQPAAQPSIEDLTSNAQQALAANPDSKDAKAALAAAEKARKDQDQEKKQAADDVAAMPGYYPHKPVDVTDLPADVAVKVESQNTAVSRYNQELKAFHAVPGPAKVDPKLKGDAAKAEADHKALTEKHAIAVVKARRALDTAENAATDGVIHALGQKDFGGLSREKVDLAARHLGVDPSSFGDDINGQVAEGKFIARLHSLTPAERATVRKVFLGQ